MAFGFFKKAQFADIIFHNGHIYTNDPEYPWAEAVACKDGRIEAVGDFDAMDQITGSDTELFDLEGKYLFPGFIDVHRSPVMKVFEDKYLDLTECQDTDDICGMVCNWADNHSDEEIIFGYGYREDLEPTLEQLDGCVDDRPVVLLSVSGITCAFNTVASTIIKDTAEEECVDIITTPYILNLMLPFDFMEIEEAVADVVEGLCEKGVTSVLNLQSPSYFEGLYQDSLFGLYNEGKLRQRFFGSYLMNRPLHPAGLIHVLMNRKTKCMETDEMIKCQMLNVHFDQKNCPMELHQETMDSILLEVAERGFDFFFEADDQNDLMMAYNALETLRNKGYRNQITIASNAKLAEEQLSSLEHCEDVYTTWKSGIYLDHPVIVQVSSTEEAIEEMTIKAAAILGMEDDLGKVEKGMLADFAIFDENPLACDLKTFSRMETAMTVLGGKIVYDLEGEIMDEMYDLFSAQML